MSAREDVAGAASTVMGVNVVARYRQSLKTLDGFVKWNGRTRGDEGLGWIDTWQVWLALPQDVQSAEAWLELNLAALVEAVDEEMVVTNATPADLVLGGNTTNGLIIEGTRPAA